MDSRANAARAAGILRARPALPALVDALRSKNSELIFECLVALQKIDDPSAGPSVSFLAHDLDNRVQATALETIGVLHSCEFGSRRSLRSTRRPQYENSPSGASVFSHARAPRRPNSFSAICG